MRLCREKIRKAKAQLELNLAAAIKDNKKCFYKYVSEKRTARENLPPLLDVEGNLATEDEEKAEEYLMLSLPQSLIVRLVILRVVRPLCWEMEIVCRMTSQLLKRWQSPTCSFTWMFTSPWGWMGSTQGY